MENPKTRVIEKKLIKVYSRVLNSVIEDPKLAFISVRDVKIAKDLSLANIYVSSLTSSMKHKNLIKQLQRCTHIFKRELAKLKIIRRIPNMKFIYDDTVQRAIKMDKKIDSLKLK